MNMKISEEIKESLLGPDLPKIEIPKTKNPVIFLFRIFGSSTFFVLLAPFVAISFFLGMDSDVFNFIFMAIGGIFSASASWLALKQKHWIYKFLGFSLIFAYLWIIIFEIIN